VFLQNRFGNTTDLVWEMKGSQGTKWQNVNIPIGSAQDFLVIFEATRGDQDHSDIAIDDVSFTPECGTGGLCSYRLMPVLNIQRKFHFLNS
jgi:hypothetical protein